VANFFVNRQSLAEILLGLGQVAARVQVVAEIV
jgi:hypothetical protein